MQPAATLLTPCVPRPSRRSLPSTSPSHWRPGIRFLLSAPSPFIFPRSHEFLNLVRDDAVTPAETVKEQNRQKQNSHQISTTEFFQETSTAGPGGPGARQPPAVPVPGGDHTGPLKRLGKVGPQAQGSFSASPRQDPSAGSSHAAGKLENGQWPLKSPGSVPGPSLSTRDNHTPITHHGRHRAELLSHSLCVTVTTAQGAASICCSRAGSQAWGHCPRGSQGGEAPRPGLLDPWSRGHFPTVDDLAILGSTECPPT